MSEQLRTIEGLNIRLNYNIESLKTENIEHNEVVVNELKKTKEINKERISEEK